MSLCPSCGSSLLQPLRSRPGKGDEMLVDLRCPECFMWMQECCSRAELAELDKRQAAWRELLVDAYERSVAESAETSSTEPSAVPSGPIRNNEVVIPTFSSRL